MYNSRFTLIHHKSSSISEFNENVEDVKPSKPIEHPHDEHIIDEEVVGVPNIPSNVERLEMSIITAFDIWRLRPSNAKIKRSGEREQPKRSSLLALKKVVGYPLIITAYFTFQTQAIIHSVVED